MTNYFEDIKRGLDQGNLEPPVGCTNAEIEALEKALGFTLPSSYKDFLVVFGRDYYGLLCGSECFIDHVIGNNEYLPEILAENGIEFELPDNYLAFYCHQGYIISWFELPAKSDNPECYIYHEANTPHPESVGSFVRYMHEDLVALLALGLELRRKPKWWQIWK